MQSVQIYFRFNKIPEQPNNKGGKDNSYFPLATLGPPASQVAISVDHLYGGQHRRFSFTGLIPLFFSVPLKPGLHFNYTTIFSLFYVFSSNSEKVLSRSLP